MFPNVSISPPNSIFLMSDCNFIVHYPSVHPSVSFYHLSDCFLSILLYFNLSCVTIKQLSAEVILNLSDACDNVVLNRLLIQRLLQDTHRVH